MESIETSDKKTNAKGAWPHLTYGRSGFFIHGGSEWGSAGCIDLTNGDEKLSRFLDGLCNCYIPIVVKYIVGSNTISETHSYWIPECKPQVK